MNSESIMELLKESKSKLFRRYNIERIHNLEHGCNIIRNEMKKIKESIENSEITDEISKKYVFLKKNI